jgi:hypothetical protein
VRNLRPSVGAASTKRNLRAALGLLAFTFSLQT